LLDQKQPGWAGKINKSILLDPEEYPSHGKIDVLFELYGNRQTGLKALGIEPDSTAEWEHGFAWLDLKKYEEEDPQPEPEDEGETESDDPAHIRWQRDSEWLYRAWYEQITARRS
jgi:hypothetical protein